MYPEINNLTRLHIYGLDRISPYFEKIEMYLYVMLGKVKLVLVMFSVKKQFLYLLC